MLTQIAGHKVRCTCDPGNQGQGILNAIGLYEWSVDVFQRAENVEDPESIMEAVKVTKIDSEAYPFDFTQDVGGKQRPHPNIFVVPVLAVLRSRRGAGG